MKLQNGYKVLYEKASEGERTFYASKTGVCDPTVDTKLGNIVDADYAGKIIYEYKGSFYVSAGKTPSYDENGVPTDERLDIFDPVLKTASGESATVDTQKESQETSVENDSEPVNNTQTSSEQDTEETLEDPVKNDLENATTGPEDTEPENEDEE